MAKKAYIGVDGKARKIKKGYIGVENFVPRALPEGYTQVEYIKSSGTTPIGDSYVNTDVIPLTADFTVVMKVRSTGDTSAENWFLTVNHDIPTGAGNYLQFGTWSSKFATHLSGVLVDGNTAATNDVITVTLSVSGATVSLTGDATYSGTNASFQSGSYRNYPITILCGNWECLSCQIYLAGVLVRDYVPCINSSGTAGLYDVVNGAFKGSATSTAFVAGNTHKGVARKIKKAYIGIGGVARPCWSGGELAYYGTITPLNVAWDYYMATSNGAYAIFAGGGNTSTAYDESLTKHTPAEVAPGTYGAAASVGDYALFGYGITTYQIQSVVAYNRSLTRTAKSGKVAKSELYATTVGGYAVFAGGKTRSSYSHATDLFDSSLTCTAGANFLPRTREYRATTVGGFGVFGGGMDEYGYASASVSAYSGSGTFQTATALSVARSQPAATTVGRYAVFAGGQNANNYTGANIYRPEVDAYDASLTKVATVEPLDAGTYQITATTVEDFAVFAGGMFGIGGKTTANVYVYDTSLTKTIGVSLSVGRQRAAAVTIGNYALFGGGYSNSASVYAQDVVDAYTVA